MTIRRTYQCNVCGDTHEPSALIGLHWALGKYHSRPARDCENHVCKTCLTNLAEIHRQQEPADER